MFRLQDGVHSFLLMPIIQACRPEAIEYSFKNTGKSRIEAIFSYNSVNFMSQPNGKAVIKPLSRRIYSFGSRSTRINLKPKEILQFLQMNQEQLLIIAGSGEDGGIH